jgi:Predicted RNA-binding protein homologous to eukaryotic snRNP
MPLDGISLGYLAKELDNTLTNGRIDKIAQPERDELHITIRNGGSNHILLLCASPACARAQLTRNKKRARSNLLRCVCSCASI